MAATFNLSGQIPRQAICFNTMPRLIHSSSLITGSSWLLRNNNKRNIKHRLCLRRQNRKHTYSVKSMEDEVSYNLDPLSASATIEEFYICINGRRLKEIDLYISSDCSFEDCSFPYPIRGKKDVMNFFQQLTAGMGQNVQFHIDHICEDQNFTVGVNWHMEWKTIPIPFTRGCSFYECTEDGETLVIKRALVLIESPIKPGGILLALLKNATAIFDDFPKAAEWCLKSPHVIINFLVNIYTRFAAPIINPFLAGYIRIWNFIARTFAFALTTLLYIIKKYFG